MTTDDSSGGDMAAFYRLGLDWRVRGPIVPIVPIVPGALARPNDSDGTISKI